MLNKTRSSSKAGQPQRLTMNNNHVTQVHLVQCLQVVGSEEVTRQPLAAATCSPESVKAALARLGGCFFASPLLPGWRAIEDYEEGAELACWLEAELRGAGDVVLATLPEEPVRFVREVIA